MTSPVAKIFNDVAELIASDTNRTNNVLNLGSPGRVIITGDIHGNRINLNKIISYASRTGQMPTIIFQELVHGPIDPRTGHDRSVEVLMRAVRLKLTHPDKVHFIMGNHDLAQFTGNEIAKEGRGVCKSFDQGIEFCFPDDAPEIIQAVNNFCRSLPVAARFDNKLWTSHTLPSPSRQKIAGYDIFTRDGYQPEDCKRGGGLYEWTWGRDQTPEQLEEIAAKLDVECFALGHRHIQEGLLDIPNRAVAINSDCQQGCILEFDSSETITFENIHSHIKQIIRL